MSDVKRCERCKRPRATGGLRHDGECYSEFVEDADCLRAQLAAALSRVAEVERERDEATERADGLKTLADGLRDAHSEAARYYKSLESSLSLERAAREKAEGERDEIAADSVRVYNDRAEKWAERDRERTARLAAESALSEARELLAGAVKSLSVGGMHLSALKLRDALRAAGLLTTEASDGR